MGKLKQMLLMMIVIGQLLGIVMLFINIKIAIFVFIVYGLAMLGIFIVLIVERLKEKEEDDENDYRNY
ncbi:hypothetical protein [Bacillus dakarensis]|uniref:hypothetical protein n=1 Tax=Robertmurraya dakarensis TaxID=1926278 RepID=UPI000981F0CA|nr:hypothetical protein [Bacillus dakarensis]